MNGSLLGSQRQMDSPGQKNIRKRMYVILEHRTVAPVGATGFSPLRLAKWLRA